MHHLNNRRKRFAWLLILVYLPIMIAITFHYHYHTEAEGATIVSHCYECEHHIHHEGHLTANQSFTHDCVLCQLHSLPYVVPTIVHIAAFVAIVHIALVMSCPFIKTRQGDIHSTRAPPILLSV